MFFMYHYSDATCVTFGHRTGFKKHSFEIFTRTQAVYMKTVMKPVGNSQATLSAQNTIIFKKLSILFIENTENYEDDSTGRKILLCLLRGMQMNRSKVCTQASR